MILMDVGWKDGHCEPAPCVDVSKMYWIVVLVLCYNHILSQPVKDEPQFRKARQLAAECCPCPGSKGANEDMLIGSSQLSRVSSLDECPCWPRNVDSEGASTIFFPSTVSVDKPSMRSIETKEDTKNLLEPEVTLATSMLDTLRVATEEEYQDALVREAARSAAEDAIPEESGQNLVIILNPSNGENDFMSEASHVQESRCIHPLESTSLDKIRFPLQQTNFLPELLKFPKLNRPNLLEQNLETDCSLGDSNLKERVFDINGVNPKLQLQTSKFSLATPFKNILNKHDSVKIFPKTSSSKQDNDDESSSNGSKFTLMPKFQLNNNDLYLNSATSNEKDLSTITDDKLSDLFTHTTLHHNLKNLLKLKDIEIVSKNVQPLNKKLFNKSMFIPTQIDRNYFNKDCNTNEQNTDMDNMAGKLSELTRPLHIKNKDYSSTFEETISKENSREAMFLDALPSSSQTQPAVSDDKIDFVSLEKIEDNLNDCDFIRNKEIKPNEKQEKHTIEVSKMPDYNQLGVTTDSTIEYFNQDMNIDPLSEGLKISEDSNTGSNNNLLNLISLDTQKKYGKQLRLGSQKSVKLDSKSDCDQDMNISYETIGGLDKSASKNILTDKKHVLLSKPISSLGETLSNFQKNVFEKVNRLNKLPSNTERYQKTRLSSNFNNDPIVDVNACTQASVHSEDHTTNSISVKDLQNMSDKLLNLNAKVDNDKSFIEAAGGEIILKNTNVISNALDNTINESTSANQINVASKSAEIDYSNNSNDKKLDVQNECLNEVNSENLNDIEKAFKPIMQNTEPKEMDTGSSNTVVNTLPGKLNSLNSDLKLRTPLFENIIVEPTSNALNLFGKPISNILNLNTNLPTLDELKDRIATIFITNDKSVEEDSSSLESDSSTYSSPLELMDPAASTTSLKRKLLNLNDFDVDIFQTKSLPTKLADSLFKTPKLNLNSYRTKVPVPNNLEFKPVKIKSGVLSRLPSNTKTSVHKSNPYNLLSHPLDISPLDDLRNNLHSNPNIFLDIYPEPKLFPDNLRHNDVKDITEKIRLNTQKTIKGLQKKIQSHNLLEDHISKPQELFDDMNDKLKAIHYDLNDRLSSIHESILDSSKINSLADKSRKTVNRHVMKNLQSKTRPTPERLQTAASTITNKRNEPNTLGAEPKEYIDTSWNKPLKFETATVNDQKPKIGTTTPPLSHLLRTPLRYNPTRPQFLTDKTFVPDFYRVHTNFNKPIFRIPESPFGHQHQQDEVKISFGTTTPRPTAQSHHISPKAFANLRPLSETYNSLSSAVGRSNLESKPTVVLSHKTKKVSDSRALSTQLSPLLRLAPESLSEEDNFGGEHYGFSREDHVKSNSRTEFREKPNHDFHTSIRNKVESIDKSKKITLPVNRYTDSSIRDVSSESSTENTDIVVDEPLKENVSFKCRMVCTKEFT